MADKPHVRWRAMTNGKPHYPELHISGAYTVWSVDGCKVVIHDPQKQCLHKCSKDTDAHILAVLKGAKGLPRPC